MHDPSKQTSFAVFSSPHYTAHLPPGHVFPMSKFARSAQLVRDRGIATVIDPGPVWMVDLCRAHTRDYVESIRTGAYNELTALRLGLPWHPTIFTRSCYATNGTLLAARRALREGLSANLAGGTHHAFADRGEGFCVFNDVAVAIRALRHDEPMLQVMVIDLDAHQGNGTNHFFKDDPGVFTFSMHVGRNYPSRKEPGSLDIELPRFVEGEVYLDRLRQELPRAVEQFEPDLVFLNAGVDVHEEDRFGQMKLSTGQMAQRDSFAIDLCRDWSIPLAVVYGGGYHRHEPTTALLHVQTIEIASRRYQAEREPIERVG